MRNVTEQAETTEPLLSQKLYDTLRRADQMHTDNLLDMGSQLTDRGFLPQASQAERMARTNITELASSVERAADSVLGSEADALRYAQKQLEDLTRQVEREIGGDAPMPPRSLLAEMAARKISQIVWLGRREMPPANKARMELPERMVAPLATGAQMKLPRQMVARATIHNPSNAAKEIQQTLNKMEIAANRQMGIIMANKLQAETSKIVSAGRNKLRLEITAQRGARGGEQQQANNNSPEQQNNSDQPGENGQQQGGQNGGEQAQNGGGGNADRLRQFAERLGQNNRAADNGGPITGNNFVNWSDQLRNVEQVLDPSDLRNQLATVRDRVGALRGDYRNLGRRPSGETVKQQILLPLAQVRVWVQEELARQENASSLVPLDRDPVPEKYSEVVRTYYEQLGSAK